MRVPVENLVTSLASGGESQGTWDERLVAEEKKEKGQVGQVEGLEV